MLPSLAKPNREVERPKYLPSHIVDLMLEEGHSGFSMHYHTRLWQHFNAKNPGKGYGVQVANAWYWYERWIGLDLQSRLVNLLLPVHEPIGALISAQRT